MVDLCRRQHQELDLTWPEVVTPSAAPPCTFRRVAEMPLQSAQARTRLEPRRDRRGGTIARMPPGIGGDACSYTEMLEALSIARMPRAHAS